MLAPGAATLKTRRSDIFLGVWGQEDIRPRGAFGVGSAGLGGYSLSLFLSIGAVKPDLPIDDNSSPRIISA